MKQGDLALLMRLCIEPEVEWENSSPSPALRRLSALGFVEVETRRCTPWKFGEGPPKHGTPDEYREWYVQERTRRSFRSRTIVAARITQAGLDFLRTEG